MCKSNVNTSLVRTFLNVPRVSVIETFRCELLRPMSNEQTCRRRLCPANAMKRTLDACAQLECEREWLLSASVCSCPFTFTFTFSWSVHVHVRVRVIHISHSRLYTRNAHAPTFAPLRDVCMNSQCKYIDLVLGECEI